MTETGLQTLQVYTTATHHGGVKHIWNIQTDFTHSKIVSFKTNKRNCSKCRCQFHQCFMYERHFGSFSSYVLDLSKNLYKKRSRITLMKLTTGVNFINILRTNFLYKRHFGSFFYVHGSCQNNVRTKNSCVKC